MEQAHIIEMFGGLTKEEPLTCLEDDTVIPNTCVLKATAPFFGYYNDAPETQANPYLYAVLDDYHAFEDILRATHNIKAKVNYPFDAVTASITMFNQTWQVIRLRDITNFCKVKHLQELFIQEGIRFKKSFKKITNQMGIIRLQKFFYLHPMGDNLYFDSTQPHHGYFIIPRYVSWDDFKNLTIQVRYETDLLYFDAATAYMYKNKDIIEMVRIYKEHLTVDKLRAIRDRYLKLMKAV